MTYRELQEALSKLSSKELDNDVMAFDGWNYEYFQIESLRYNSEYNPEYVLVLNFLHKRIDVS